MQTSAIGSPGRRVAQRGAVTDVVPISVVDVVRMSGENGPDRPSNAVTDMESVHG